jgi:hypothetical protein
MRVLVWVLASGALSGCSQPECEALSDCESNENCVDGVCQPRVGGKLDAGIRPDTGIVLGPDTGTTTDAGIEPSDAGMMGNNDGGIPMTDAGSGDAGLGALPSSGDFGFVWAGELYGETTSSYHAFGLLQRLDATTFDRTEQTYPDGEDTACSLWTRRLIGGTPIGFEAQEISVIPGPQPFSPFSMYPIGNGRYEPIQDPVERMYNKSRTALFQIYGTSNMGSVDGALVGVTAPGFVFEDVAYPRGQPIPISPPPELRWRPHELTNGFITIELFASARDVVLTCLIGDDGVYTIPSMAVSDFLDALPVPPVYLEIRYDREVMTNENLLGGGTIPVTYRASQGLRYPVTLP